MVLVYHFKNLNKFAVISTVLALFVVYLLFVIVSDKNHDYQNTAFEKEQFNNDENIKPNIAADETTIERKLPMVSTADFKNIKVVCIILTRPFELTSKAKTVWQTWAKRCDKTHFATSADTNQLNINEFNLPILKTSVSNEKGDTRFMSAKLFESLDLVNEIYKTSEDINWFFIADDDTYAIIENLKDFINEKQTNESVNYTRETYGYNFDYDFHSGGAGILFHRQVLTEFAKNFKTKCSTYLDGPGDVMLSKCLKLMNINMGESRDTLNLDRFLPLALLGNWAQSPTSKLTVNCCSEKTISFHYIQSHEMLKIDTLLYKIKIPRDYV